VSGPNTASIGLRPARDLRSASGLRQTRSSTGRTSSHGTTAAISTSLVTLGIKARVTIRKIKKTHLRHRQTQSHGIPRPSYRRGQVRQFFEVP
jgi:hypothetical protein